MATTKNLAPPGAIGKGPTISISHCEKGQADMMDVISCFGFLGRVPNLRFSQIGVIQLSPSSWTMSATPFFAMDLFCMTSTRTFFSAKFGKGMDARSASYSASLLVVSNSNLNAYVYSFPSGLTTIRPALKPSELEALLVNSFYAFLVGFHRCVSYHILKLWLAFKITYSYLNGVDEDLSKSSKDQAKEIKHLKAQIKKLKKKAKPIITHHRAWMKSVSLKKRLAGKKSLKSIWMQKESMETEDAQDVRRTRDVVNEENETVDDEVSTERCT
ncbi:hypothetical protein Tco_1273939 [Tanacetum coccineum]